MSQAFRALNQALGRCIRHKRDYGAIVLLDERFGDTYRMRDGSLYRDKLSAWVRGDSMHVCTRGDLQRVQQHVPQCRWLSAWCITA